MKYRVLLQSLLIALMLPQFGVSQSADQIVSKMADNIVAGDKYAEIKVEMNREDWDRTFTFKIWTRGENNAYIKLTSPEREAGIVFLMNEAGLWNWQPQIKRTIQLPSSMMMQSWMGTDLTFDDLLGATSLQDKYSANLIGEESVKGKNCYMLDLIPKDESSVLWGKIKTWISKSDYLQMRAEYYDEDGELIHTMQASDITRLAGRMLPSRVEIIPASQEEGKTTITYLDVSLDPRIPSDFFNESNLGTHP